MKNRQAIEDDLPVRNLGGHVAKPVCGGDRGIRTPDFLHAMQALWPAELYPHLYAETRFIASSPFVETGLIASLPSPYNSKERMQS